MLNRNFLRFIATNLFIFSAIIFHTNSAYAQSECDDFINICNIGSQLSWNLVRYVNNNTAEVGEPVPHTFYTVAQNPITTEWYRWTAPQNGVVVVDTAGTNPNALPLLYTTPFNVDTLTAVYTGTALSNLVRVDESDNWFVNNLPDSSCSSQRPIPESFFSSCMKFSVVAGTTYHFQMDHLDNPQTLPTSLFHLTLRYLAPSAASVSIGGRVVSESGRSLSRTRITLTDTGGNVRMATANSFGYYRFENVEVGQTYTIQAIGKGLQFQNNPRVIAVYDELQNEDFISDTNSISKRE